MTIKLTREEAIQDLKAIKSFERYARGRLALDVAIEALEREPSEDGTLEVKVDDATKIGRVLISDDKHRGGLYYPDEDEPKGDLISRAEAIEALRYAQHRFTVADEAGGMGSVKWSEDVIYFAAAERVLTELPSADRPTDGDLISRAEAIEALGEEPLVWCDEEYEIAERNQWREDVEAIESVPSADRPRGYWKDGKWCSVCGMPIATDVWGTSVDESEVHYCIECGAEMRGETNE